MPLSDGDLQAQGVTVSLGIVEGPPPLGAPDAVVMCFWCGYTVRTHAPDRCPCGRVAVEYDGDRPVLRDPEGATSALVFRLVPSPPAV